MDLYSEVLPTHFRRAPVCHGSLRASLHVLRLCHRPICRDADVRKRLFSPLDLGTGVPGLGLIPRCFLFLPLPCFTSFPILFPGLWAWLCYLCTVTESKIVEETIKEGHLASYQDEGLCRTSKLNLAIMVNI